MLTYQDSVRHKSWSNFIWSYMFLLISISSCSVSKTTNNTTTKPADMIVRAEIEKMMQNWPDSVQLAIGIVKGEDINTYGFQNLPEGITTIQNADKIFSIGSISKVFTGILLAEAIEERRVSHDTQLSEVLSYPLHQNLEIQLGSLANHSAGLPRLSRGLMLRAAFAPKNPYKVFDHKKMKKYLSKQLQLDTTNIGKFSYSNMSAGVLGYALEQVYEQRYEQLIQEKICQNIAMQSTSCDFKQFGSRLVQGLNQKGKATPTWEFASMQGAGGLFSTVSDMCKFIQAIHKEDKPAFVRAQMPTLQVNDLTTIGMGWHIIKNKKGTDLLFHNGGTAGYTASLLINNTNKTGIIILSNLSAYHKQVGNIDMLALQILTRME